MFLLSMSWIAPLNPFTASHRVQLLLTSVLSGVVVGASILGFQSQKKIELLASSEPISTAGKNAADARVSVVVLLDTG